MADATVGALKYRFEADMSGFKAGIASANDNLKKLSANAADMSRSTSASAQQVGRSFKDMSEKVASAAYELGPWTGQHVDIAKASVDKLHSAFGLAGVGIVASIAAISLALLGLAKGGAAALEELDKIDEVTRRIGVSANAMRGLELFGSKNRVDSDAARKGLSNAGDEFEKFKRNSGEIKEAFDKIDSKFISVLDKTRTFEQFWDAVTSKIKSLPREEGIDIAKALLGDDTGQKLYDGIMRGEAGMAALKKATEDAGLSLSDKLVKKAADLQREVDSAANIAKTKLLDAFNEIAPIIAKIKTDFWDAVGAVPEWVRGLQRINDYLQPIADILNKINEFSGKAGRKIGDSLREDGAIGQLREEMKYGKAQTDRPTRDLPVPANINWNGEAEKPLVVKQRAPAPSPIGVTRKRYSDRDEEDEGGGKSKAAERDPHDSITKYIEGLKEAQKLAQVEADTWNKGNVERTKAVDLVKAEAIAQREKTTLTAQDREQIAAAATATANLKDKVEGLKKAQEDLKNVAKQWADTFVSALDDLIIKGKKFGDVLRDLLKSLASMALKGLLMGGGGGGGGILGSLFGSLFGNFKGLFAEGGNIPAGGWGIAGERGPELITGPATVTPPHKMGMAGGNGVIVHNYAAGVEVTPRVTPQGVMMIVREAINQNNHQLPGFLAERQARSY